MLRVCLILFTCLWHAHHCVHLRAQDTKIWEFSPYEIEIWCAFEPSLTVSESARQRFQHELQSLLERDYKAAWHLTITSMPSSVQGQIVRAFDNLQLNDLTYNESVLALSLKHPETRSLRTYEAAAAELGEIFVTSEIAAELRKAARDQESETTATDSDLASNNNSGSDPTQQLLAKLTMDSEGIESLRTKLIDGTIAAAMLPRPVAAEIAENARVVSTFLPWQTDAIFRKRDKLFFLLVGREGDDFTFKARELDCSMQFMGESFGDTTSEWAQASRLAAKLITRSFAPIARVEDAEAKSATLRQRAGGLITDDNNPARIRVGDVLQPIVRRDDRNGVPTLLQPLSFTYAAITASDGIDMQANVYTYSGGPGLQGRKNRRTQRILLRLRPKTTKTDIQISVRSEPGRAQPGCFIYLKDHFTEEFQFLGRTDWRGRFTIDVPMEMGAILPEELRKQRALANQKRKEAAEAAAIAEVNAIAGQSKTEGSGNENDDRNDNDASAESSAEPDTATPATSSAGEATAIAPGGVDSLAAAEAVAAELSEAEYEASLVALNFPLLQLFVKSGDTVLAKLPLVPGLQEIEVAELPDDSQRLQAEAFVRGFQNDILDLIGLRNLLAARVRYYIESQELGKAEESMKELRRLRTFNEMSDELSSIQRRVLEESDAEVPRAAKARIDRMFQNTRDMLQKFLQDDLVAKTEQSLNSATGVTAN